MKICCLEMLAVGFTSALSVLMNIPMSLSECVIMCSG